MVRKSLTLFDSGVHGSGVADSFAKRLAEGAGYATPDVRRVHRELLTHLVRAALPGQGEAPASSFLRSGLALVHLLFANFPRRWPKRSKARRLLARLENNPSAQEVAVAKFVRTGGDSRAQLAQGRLVSGGNRRRIQQTEWWSRGCSVDEAPLPANRPVFASPEGLSAVTGGTRRVVRLAGGARRVNPGEAFIDRMIAMSKEPNGKDPRTKSH